LSRIRTFSLGPFQVKRTFWKVFFPIQFGGGVWGGGEGGAASWEGGAVDDGSVNAFLAAALARVMRVAVPIPAVASASVLHSAAVGGSVVGVLRPL